MVFCLTLAYVILRMAGKDESLCLHFAVASCKLTDGLVGQLEEYLKA